MGGGTPAETARAFLEGDANERLSISAGPLRETFRVRLQLWDGAPPKHRTIIRSLEVVHEDATSAVVLADGEVEGVGSLTGPVTLERRNGRWRVVDYSTHGMRTLERLLAATPTDVRKDARATIVLLHLGATGPEGELRVENDGPAELEVREIWLGRRARWARALVRGPAQVAPGADGSFAFSRSWRTPDRIVAFTDRDPFVLDLRGEGRDDVPLSLRWTRSRWRYTLQLLPALVVWPLFGWVAGAILVVGLAGLLALGLRQQRAAFR